MKQIYKLFLILLVATLVSCNFKNEMKSNKLETIDATRMKLLPFESLIDDIRYVKLETKSNNMIGSISQLLLTDSLIIVVDKTISKSIFVFTKDGHFLRKIGEIGSGPKDYQLISHVFLSSDKNELCVVSMKKIIHYNLNGTFVKSESINFLLHYVEDLDQNSHVGYNSFGKINRWAINNNMLIVTNDNWKIKYSALPSNQRAEKLGFQTSTPLIKIKSEVYAIKILSDTIYLVDRNGIIPRYYVKMGNKKITIGDIVRNVNNVDLSSLNIGFNGCFIKLNDAVVVDVLSKTIPYLFYSSKTKITYSYNIKQSLKNPFARFMNNVYCQDNNDRIISVASPARILEAKNELYKSNKKEQIDKLFDGLSEDNNPVLFYYHVNIKESK